MSWRYAGRFCWYLKFIPFLITICSNTQTFILDVNELYFILVMLFHSRNSMTFISEFFFDIFTNFHCWNYIDVNPDKYILKGMITTIEFYNIKERNVGIFLFNAYKTMPNILQTTIICIQISINSCNHYILDNCLEEVNIIFV